MSNYDALRERLVHDRLVILQQCGVLEANAADLAASHASGDMRRELLAEGDTVSVERSLIAKISEGAQSTLAAIDMALARMDAGTYGSCASCTGEIPVQRLEARPQSVTCVPCASRR